MRTRLALLTDLPVVLELMRGYYRDDGLDFDRDRCAATMTRLLQEPQWGSVCLLETEGVGIGYVAICLGFSLELGGNDAFVDEVFVLPEYRGQGYGHRLLEFAATEAHRLGATALHLEVDRGNIAAQRLYGSLQFKRRDRYFIMTRRLR
jgi:GNAT superfamily N-acetyltransferase